MILFTWSSNTRKCLPLLIDFTRSWPWSPAWLLQQWRFQAVLDSAVKKFDRTKIIFQWLRRGGGWQEPGVYKICFVVNCRKLVNDKSSSDSAGRCPKIENYHSEYHQRKDQTNSLLFHTTCFMWKRLHNHQWLRSYWAKTHRMHKIITNNYTLIFYKHIFFPNFRNYFPSKCTWNIFK